MLNKFNYIISQFNKIYSIPDGKFEINYGVDNQSKIQIVNSKTKYFETKSEYNLNNVIWKNYSGNKIPFLFDEKNDDKLLVEANGLVIINYDIIASSFYLLSGWQELVCVKKDKLGRFPYIESIQYKLKIVEKPIVNYYFLILKEAIEKAYNIKLEVKLWGDKNFATFLTHDIDYYPVQVSSLFKNYKNIFKYCYNLLRNRNFISIEEYLKIENSYSAKSMFFFMTTQGTHKSGCLNSNYNLSDNVFKKLFYKIKKSGSQTGLHSSFDTCRDLDKLKIDLEKFPKVVDSNRFHFLEFDIEKTPSFLEKLNIKYDYTLGFSEHIGFRNSFCFPFNLYDFNKNKSRVLLSIPLNIMDSTLYSYEYDNNYEKIITLIDEVKKFNGAITILWHNTNFYNTKNWKSDYKKIVKYIKVNKSLFNFSQNKQN